MSQQHPVNAILEAWNDLGQDAAAEAVLPCNGSAVWAYLLAYNRPFATPDSLFTTADDIWQSLPEEDWQQAFDSHPRIGEHKAKAATEQSLKWSAGEQSAAAIDTATEERLAVANKDYEQKFGRIFIVCASGKTAAEMLAILTARLSNDAAAELEEAAEQQRQITQLRLRKWLDIK
jgi:2-oxo-4-hydroxy-4-carboxy-5-ureidoimidazoline decarboxylase